MSRIPVPSLRLFLLGLAACVGSASADIVLEGHHSVPIKVCYTFRDSVGHLPLAVVRTVSRKFFYHPLRSGDCVDQGYKFNTVSLFWADSLRLADGLPDSSTDPRTVAWLDSIRCLSHGGTITSNQTQYPDSIPITSEAWTYTILGRETAVTTISQSATRGDSTLITTMHLDYFWGSGALAVRRSAKAGLALESVRGSKVRLTIPDGVATLRVMTLSGRVLRQLRILPTGGQRGEVDLGMVPPPGSFVELRQGGRSSVLPVQRR